MELSARSLPYLWGGVNVMSLAPEQLYFQLGSLIAEMPEFTTGPITPEAERWIERAVDLVELAGGLADKLQLRVAAENLHGAPHDRNVETILAIVHRVLAKVERDAPADLQGAFIVTSNAFDAFAAIRRILGSAQTDVLLVDPQADAKALTDFALFAPDKVVVRLLADHADHKASLESAARDWVRRFGRARPLSVRLAAAGALRDTLILVDDAIAWALGQPFNRFARRAHPSLVRIPPRAATPMIAAYAAQWDAAGPLLPDA
jgi:hypothetical protein